MSGETKLLDKAGMEHLVSGIKNKLAKLASKDLSNVDNSTFAEKASAAGSAGSPIVAATGDGATYTASVPGVTSLKTGLTITIIPDTTSTTTLPKLNINSLGAKNIKQSLTANTTTTVQAASESWMQANKPVLLQYDGTQWRTVGTRSNANDLYGIVAIEHGGTGADNAADALINLGATSATSTIVTIPTTWAEQADGTYAQTVSVDGVTSDESQPVIVDCDTPHVDIDADIAVMEAWSCVNSIKQGDGTLTFVCYGDIPTVSIPLNVVVM